MWNVVVCPCGAAPLMPAWRGGFSKTCKMYNASAKLLVMVSTTSCYVLGYVSHNTTLGRTCRWQQCNPSHDTGMFTHVHLYGIGLLIQVPNVQLAIFSVVNGICAELCFS